MKALIYCRVSSEKQVKEGNGLQSQEKRCRDYARSQNYDVLAVFRDGAKSGSLLERPAMKNLLDCLESNDSLNPNDKIAVIFDDIKRFARGTIVHFQLKKEIYSRNGIVESPNFKFEDTPDGIFVETVMAAHAELERNQNRRQVIQKQKARFENGYYPFPSPPLGLKFQTVKEHGKILVRNEPYATIIKEALEKYVAHELNTQDDIRLFILDKYKEAGIEKTLSINGVQTILNQVLYAGYVEYKPWEIDRRKGKHEGFITIELFEKVRAKSQSRTKKWVRNDYSKDFALRTHIICSKCIKPVTASWNTGRNKKRYANYFCHTQGCIYEHKVTRNLIVEARFEELLAKVSLDSSILDLSKLVLTNMWSLKQENYGKTQANAITQKKELQEKISSILVRITKATNEEIIALYENEIGKLTKEIKEIEWNIKTNPYNDERFGTALEKVFNVLKDPVNTWKSENIMDKKAVLYVYFDGKVEYDYAKGFGTANLAYPVKLIGDLANKNTSNVEMGGIEPPSKNHI